MPAREMDAIRGIIRWREEGASVVMEDKRGSRKEGGRERERRRESEEEEGPSEY